MSEPTVPATEEPESIQLSPAELASVQKAREGFSEVNPNNPPPSGPQRPDHIPEKFWDAEKGEVRVEALVKSYSELEKSRSAPKEEPAETSEAPPAEPSKDGKIEKPKAAEGEPEVSPLTELLGKVQTEYSENNQIGEETLGELAKAGIPKEIAETYLEGLQALADRTVGEIHAYVGGKDQYAKMSEWAAKQLSDDDLDAFNTALDNPKLRETAVRGLYARFQAANPGEGNLRGPQGGQSATGGDVFTSKDQVLEAMRDPKYAQNASYRQEVQDKLARSQRVGFKMRQESLFERRIASF